MLRIVALSRSRVQQAARTTALRPACANGLEGRPTTFGLPAVYVKEAGGSCFCDPHLSGRMMKWSNSCARIRGRADADDHETRYGNRGLGAGAGTRRFEIGDLGATGAEESEISDSRFESKRGRGKERHVGASPRSALLAPAAVSYGLPCLVSGSTRPNASSVASSSSAVSSSVKSRIFTCRADLGMARS